MAKKRMSLWRKVALLLALALMLQLLLGATVSNAAPPPSGGFWYTVRWGDNLSSIAWRYGVSPWTVAQANGIYNLNRIYAGQRLWIPSGGYSPPVYCGFWYTVRWGDNLSSIGWRYGTTAWAICNANGLANCNYIYAGQRLWIPCDP